MQGRIIKGIGGFYYIYSMGNIYECKPRGKFRKDLKKPLVGDQVLFSYDEATKQGSIEEICERKNELIRPVVSNVDQVLLVFAMADPKPNLNLLDRFIIWTRLQEVSTVLLFHKADLVSDNEKTEYRRIYEPAGFECLFVSSVSGDGRDDLKSLLKDRTTVIAGPSGVGKSTLINYLSPYANMETGEISQKIKRGRHTTRHSEIFPIDENSFLVDTPGFTSLQLPELTPEELEDYYPEFEDYKNQCRFVGCSHINEPDCSVKQALEDGKFSRERFESYQSFYQELKSQKKY